MNYKRLCYTICALWGWVTTTYILGILSGFGSAFEIATVLQAIILCIIGACVSAVIFIGIVWIVIGIYIGITCWWHWVHGE